MNFGVTFKMIFSQYIALCKISMSLLLSSTWLETTKDKAHVTILFNGEVGECKITKIMHTQEERE